MGFEDTPTLGSEQLSGGQVCGQIRGWRSLKTGEGPEMRPEAQVGGPWESILDWTFCSAQEGLKASLVVGLVKNCLHRRPRFDCWVPKIPWSLLHSSVLA